MKGYILAAGLILATVPAMGQTTTPLASYERPCMSNTIDVSRVNMSQLKKNYLRTLQSDNDGVQESCLALVAQVRILLPQEDMKEIEGTISRLVTKGRTPVIRYKAYLAAQVFANPAVFHDVASTSYANYDDIFVALSSQLQHTMLGYSSR